MTYQSFNPATGKLLKKFEELSDTQLETKLAKANECFAEWKMTSFAERAKIIGKAGELLHERAEELAKTMTLEMGKRIDEARGEVEFSAKIMAYYAKNAESFLADTKLPVTMQSGMFCILLAGRPPCDLTVRCMWMAVTIGQVIFNSQMGQTESR